MLSNNHSQPVLTDAQWFAENPKRFLRLRYGAADEPHRVIAFCPHDAGPIHILPVSEEPSRWSWSHINYDDVWLFSPAFEALSGRHVLRCQLALCMEKRGRLPRVRTADEYEAGQPRANAEVFIDVWHRTIHGIDDEGLFESGEGSAGTRSFRTVVEDILGTDVGGKLSRRDAEDAAAMVYHISPRFEAGERETS